MNNNLIQTAASNVAKAGKAGKTMQQYIKAMEGEIAKALPSVITPERFTRMVLTAVSSNKELAAVTPQSFMGAMMTAAQLGLEPNTPLGEAYLIPYRNKGTLEAQFQLGYRGMIALAYRSGQVEMIQAHTVYENDIWEYELGLNPKLRLVPAMKDRGNPIAYWALVTMNGGKPDYRAMTIDEIRSIAEVHSPSYNSKISPWKTSFNEMAKKTVLKRTLKYAPLKSDFARMLDQDGTIKTEISPDMYEVKDDTVYDVEYETGEVIEAEAKQADPAATPEEEIDRLFDKKQQPKGE